KQPRLAVWPAGQFSSWQVANIGNTTGRSDPVEARRNKLGARSSPCGCDRTKSIHSAKGNLCPGSRFFQILGMDTKTADLLPALQSFGPMGRRQHEHLQNFCARAYPGFSKGYGTQ